MHFLSTIGFHTIYAIVLVVSLWRYPKYYDTPLRFLPILFLYTFLNELLGYLITIDEDIALVFSDLTDNSVIYNVYSIISYLYYLYIFWSCSKNQAFRNNVLYGSLIFLISCVVNVFVQSFSSGPQTLSYLVGGCILLYCTLSYLRSFFVLPQEFQLKQNLLFWFSLGLSIFYIGYLPIKILRFFSNEFVVSTTVRNIHLSLIILMYTLFIVGFIKMRRPLRKTMER
ncbi:hypothetical protein RQM65_03415 [Pricia sp. S334]|uniref:Uncharacterized protein n=1 Tax=Pricia mediterranea TaxID=3076079 RepID=A0ABU3L1V1_9FLAO|nr:hypothetical protein [Pricia sp. S334]MDT7827714.1 hypothetical protein [Pricia sp. S334]